MSENMEFISSSTSQSNETFQYSTFYIDDRWYGIDVTHVQEVLKCQPMTMVPLAPNFVHGLINLRGQIATAIGVRELFGLDTKSKEDTMNIVCEVDDNLIALIVDKIGDVVELPSKDFESSPETISQQVKRFMSGVCKTDGPILSVVDVQKVSKSLNAEKGMDGK